jgi:hypothetical protein
MSPPKLINTNLMSSYDIEVTKLLALQALTKADRSRIFSGVSWWFWGIGLGASQTIGARS